MKLLLVEDEKRMGQALCELLRQEKYEVDWYQDGRDGADALEGDVYDLAVLDVMLPHKNGFDIAKDARKQGIKTPILMLTARSDTDDKVTGLDCGADDYLTKPFVPRELLARLRALTRRQYDVDEDHESCEQQYRRICAALRQGVPGAGGADIQSRADHDP